ncbi:MAG: DUF3237 family protein [Bacteroidota bacterium]
MNQIEIGELLYECTLNPAGFTEYGTSLRELMSGKVVMPPEGVRCDAYFEGPATGEKLKGTVKGVDYLRVRPDGRMELDVHAEITTEDGEKISLKADGVCIPRKNSSISDLRENVTLFTSYKKYTWMNKLQVWGIGTIDLATEIINLKVYSA